MIDKLKITQQENLIPQTILNESGELVQSEIPKSEIKIVYPNEVELMNKINEIIDFINNI